MCSAQHARTTSHTPTRRCSIHVRVTPDDQIVQEVFISVVNEAGWDHAWAPVIAESMRQLGLREVDAESIRRYTVGGDVGSVRINHFSTSVLRDQMMATGRVASGQIDACLERLRNPTVGHLSFETWYAWGRRPAPAQSCPQPTQPDR
jgi:hypothetical protein